VGGQTSEAGSLIRLRDPSSLRGRDPRVVGGFWRGWSGVWLVGHEYTQGAARHATGRPSLSHSSQSGCPENASRVSVDGVKSRLVAKARLKSPFVGVGDGWPQSVRFRGCNRPMWARIASVLPERNLTSSVGNGASWAPHRSHSSLACVSKGAGCPSAALELF